ncbi:MAG: hypothetical protein LBR58_06870 [Propionibacteriaceae bacterium]|nr:hypothetical protein [Propionibacteriaceae bacterium]
MINELGIYYLPDVAAARVRSWKRRLITNAAFFVGIAVLDVALALGLMGEANVSVIFIAIALLGLLLPVAIAFFSWRRAEADADNCGQGLALGINREGILFRERWLTWAEVGELVVEPSRWSGAQRLTVTARDNSQAWLPLSYTDTMPASLDTAVRALSAGQASVDLSRLDA